MAAVFRENSRKPLKVRPSSLQKPDNLPQLGYRNPYFASENANCRNLDRGPVETGNLLKNDKIGRSISIVERRVGDGRGNDITLG